MKPKVSIVIPVYNGSNYMREAIDSALNQTYDNCEVIVINDGSNDEGKTDEIAKSYGDKIRYFYKANGGVSTAINLGIEKMTGEYFAWLSHDDIFYSDKIEKQINAILNSGDRTAIAHSNFDFLYMETGRKISINWLEQYKKNQLENGNFPSVFLCIHGSTVLIHKSHFLRVGNYRTDLLATQDSEFLFRVMRGQKTVFVAERLIVGRIHKEQGQQTMKCHKTEYNQMFINFCNELTLSEKTEMCGSEINFYYRLYCLLKNSKPADKILKYLGHNIKKCECNHTNRCKMGEMIIDELKAESIQNTIFIFGAGQYGREAVLTLQSYGISNMLFLDNDMRKRGKIIEGIECILPEDVSTLNTSIVIICMQNSDEVYAQLINMGIKKIMKYTSIKKELFLLLPEKLIL